jgi:hypothetical protein
MREKGLFPNFLVRILPGGGTGAEFSPENSPAADGEVTLG